MPDGSDATQSPGPSGEWPRRMWAGGEVFFSHGQGRGGRGGRLLLGEGAVCEEEVVGVERKGGVGGALAKEKVFVWFERRYYGGLLATEAYICNQRSDHQWEALKSRLLPAVREKRCLVFMKQSEGNHSLRKADAQGMVSMERKIVRRKLPSSVPSPFFQSLPQIPHPVSSQFGLTYAIIKVREENIIMDKPIN